MRTLKGLHLILMLLFGLVIQVHGQNAPVAAKQGAPIRTGLWVLQPLPENDRELNAFAEGVRGNRRLAGVCIHIHWKDVEKESGKLDFGKIDQAVSVLRDIGMKYQLCFYGGVNTPGYVYKEGAQSFATTVTNPHRPNFGQAVVIPLPWDSIFERNFSRVIKQLGQRYASDPLCVSVVLTCANFMSAEMHLPRTREDVAKWKALGDYDQKLFEVYKKYTDEWAKAFPRQEISLHVSKVIDLPPRFCERVIDYGLNKHGSRFTIQNCQLTGRREDTGMMTYDVIQEYRDRAHHGFQSLSRFSYPNDRMGSIEMAVLNMVHAEGEYWELWHRDGMSVETSTAVATAWDEARQIGYDAYKKKLISEGKYRER
ncbi:MAG TPA: hypothetical protein VFQ78_06185 [Candidatus Udaeobacter sp.]|jgi:hypothetical protein|nr:hypothetical protein [Candidatus Udaeobacter sp.]